MEHMDGRRRLVGFAAWIFLFLGIAASGEARRVDRFADLDGGRIGILTGSLAEYVVNGTLNRTQLFYYDTLDAMFLALRRGELDGVVDDATGQLFAARDPRYRVVPGTLFPFNYAMLFPEGSDIVGDFDRVLGDLRREGVVERLVEKWTSGGGGPTGDYERYSGDRLVRLGVHTEAPPFAYRDGQRNLVGIDIELVEHICRRLGYRLEVTGMGLDALFDAVAEGRVDVAASRIAVTDDRRRLGVFGVAYGRDGICALVMDENTP